MPVAKGLVEGTPVKVLRDTGCSTIVVRRALVPDDKLTGRVERCILIDGTVRYTPGAKIYVQTPFFSGLTTAICTENPIYDLVIGNVPGAENVSISPAVEQTTQAVQTEGQEKATKDSTPILTPLIDSGTECVAKPENETLHQVVKSASSDRIDDSSSPHDSVAVEMTGDAATTSIAAEVNKIRGESVQPKPESRYQYSGNQCSSLNPESKKQYDRNFVLKLHYEPTSMIRNVNLPALPDIILNETTPGQTNDMVLRHKSMELDRSSVASPPDFLPWFVKFASNGDRCTQGDYHQRRRPTQQTGGNMGNGHEELRKHQVFQKRQFNYRVKETVTDVKGQPRKRQRGTGCLSRNPLEEDDEEATV